MERLRNIFLVLEASDKGILFPFLFHCSYGMSLLIQKAVSTEKVPGFKVKEHGQTVTHLQFAYDTLVFIVFWLQQTSSADCERYLNPFHYFLWAQNKLQNVGGHEEAIWAAELLGCSVGTFPTTYLGQHLGASNKKEV